MAATSTLNETKYTNALLYFVTKCGNDHLGLMKLNKLFYYLDFISFRDRGESVTGETYLRLPKGPYASALDEKIIKSAVRKNLITHLQDDSEKFGKRNRYAALVSPDLTVFNEYEKNLLENISRKFRDWSTDQMVAQTHTEAPWVFSKPEEPLKYSDADDIDFFLSCTPA